MAQARLPIGRAAAARSIGLRQSERRNADHGAFDGAGHGAGIDHVLAGIAAAIDAGEDEIGALAVEHVARAHDDAIGGRTAHGEAPLGDLAQPQRIVERQRMGDARLVVFRRDHPDIVGEGARDLLADVEALGVDAVIIGDQDAHGTHCFSIFLMPPI